LYCEEPFRQSERLDAGKPRTASIFVSQWHTLGGDHIDDSRSHPASDRPPDNFDRTLRWQIAPETAAGW